MATLLHMSNTEVIHCKASDWFALNLIDMVFGLFLWESICMEVVPFPWGAICMVVLLFQQGNM